MDKFHRGGFENASPSRHEPDDEHTAAWVLMEFRDA